MRFFLFLYCLFSATAWAQPTAIRSLTIATLDAFPGQDGNPTIVEQASYPKLLAVFRQMVQKFQQENQPMEILRGRIFEAIVTECQRLKLEKCPLLQQKYRAKITELGPNTYASSAHELDKFIQAGGLKKLPDGKYLLQALAFATFSDNDWKIEKLFLPNSSEAAGAKNVVEMKTARNKGKRRVVQLLPNSTVELTDFALLSFGTRESERELDQIQIGTLHNLRTVSLSQDPREASGTFPVDLNDIYRSQSGIQKIQSEIQQTGFSQLVTFSLLSGSELSIKL